MIDRDDVLDALTKCTGYDPVHFPRPSIIMADAWLEYFGKFPAVTKVDLLAAVAKFYESPARPVPQPADIGVIARAIRQDKSDRETLEERAVREEAIDAKAEGRLRAITEYTQKFGGRR